jgi:type I restriction enzyme S subunit
MNEIANIKIAAIGHTVTGKTPSSNNPDDFGTEFMFVTPSDSFDSKTIIYTERSLSEEGVSKLSNKLLPPKSVMITCIGSAMGKVSMNKTRCITNQQINSIIPSKNYHPDYIYYSVKNNYKLLRNASTGSTALPLLNKTDFDLLELPIHTNKNTQQKIVNVLS